MSMKNSNDTIGKGTRDLSGCSAVPQTSCNNHVNIHRLSEGSISQFFKILSGRQSHHVVQTHHSELPDAAVGPTAFYRILSPRKLQNSEFLMFNPAVHKVTTKFQRDTSTHIAQASHVLKIVSEHEMVIFKRIM